MREVWKYTVDMVAATSTDGWSVAMPANTVARHVGAQRIQLAGLQTDALTLWAEGDVPSPREEHTFYVVGTGPGHPDPAWSYVGTAQVNDFVWHLYENPS